MKNYFDYLNQNWSNANGLAATQLMEKLQIGSQEDFDVKIEKVYLSEDMHYLLLDESGRFVIPVEGDVHYVDATITDGLTGWNRAVALLWDDFAKHKFALSDAEMETDIHYRAEILLKEQAWDGDLVEYSLHIDGTWDCHYDVMYLLNELDSIDKKFHLITVPDSQEEKAIEGMDFSEAYKIHEQGNFESMNVHSFSSEEERNMFIRGYQAGIGYNGEGLFIKG